MKKFIWYTLNIHSLTRSRRKEERKKEIKQKMNADLRNLITSFLKSEEEEDNEDAFAVLSNDSSVVRFYSQCILPNEKNENEKHEIFISL